MRVVHVIPKGLTNCYGSEVKVENGDHDFENLLKVCMFTLDSVVNSVIRLFFISR